MDKFWRSLMAVLLSFVLFMTGFWNPVFAEEEINAETEEPAVAEQEETEVLTEKPQETEEEITEEPQETEEEIAESGFEVPETVGELTENEGYYGYLRNGEVQWLSFMPTETESYDLWIGGYQTTVSVIDDEGTVLETCVVGDESITVSVEMEAGRTYYLKLEEADNVEGGYSVSIGKTPVIIAEAVGGSTVEVDSGASVTLEVTAYSRKGGTLTYHWGVYSETELPEVTDQNTLVLDSVTRSDSYYCDISDEYGNTAWVSFDVRVNHFSVDQNRYNVIHAVIGSDEELKVKLKGDDTSHVTYEWYVCDVDENGVALSAETLIDGASTDSYKAENIQTGKQYTCNVSDGYGNTDYVQYLVLALGISAELEMNKWIDVDLGDNNQNAWISFAVPEDDNYIIKASTDGSCYLSLYEKGTDEGYFGFGVSENSSPIFRNYFKKKVRICTTWLRSRKRESHIINSFLERNTSGLSGMN